MAYGQNTTVPNFSNAVGQTPSARWRFSVLNDMLLAIDHPGIDYNDNINDTMEGQHALRIFTDAVYNTQALGWEFNTLNSLTITLDSEGKYTFGVTEGMPLGCSYVFSVVGQADNLFVNQQGVLRTRNLELSNDGTVLGEPNTEIVLDEVIIELWNEMHFSLTQYVGAVAVDRYQKLMVGDSAKKVYTEQDIMTKYADARRDEIRSGKYNMLTSTAGQEVSR